MTPTADQDSFGAWVMVLASAFGAALSLYNDLTSGTSIDHTYGALPVVASSTLVMLASLVLAHASVRRWLRGTLLALLMLGVVGTGTAAYFLESYVLLALMVLALFGWTVRMLSRPGESGTNAHRYPSEALTGKGVVLAFVLLLPSLAARAQGSGGDQVWPTFNGDLRAQKYATATQITPQNVQNLRKAWEVHTGDVSDGSGDRPMTDWSATPLFVNDTVYVGTPFYRIFALDPGTGQVRWTFDPHAELKALTQPDLKSRGVAY